jgi:vacuolar-type H+-ATPase subunit E/Vma4
MALADILAAIDAGADEEIARVSADASDQVERLRRDAQDEARHVAEEASSALDEDAARRRAQIVNRAELAVERHLKAAAEEIYQEIIVDVERRIAEVRHQPGYADLFGRLFEECRAVLPDGRVVRVDPADESLCHRTLADTGDDGFTVDATLQSVGGLELVTDDGRKSVRNTLEARTWRADRALRSLAAAEVPALRGDA